MQLGFAHLTRAAAPVRAAPVEDDALADPAVSAEAGAWLRQFTSIGLIALATLAAFTPAAGLLKLLFPAYAGAVAAFLFLRQRTAHYVSFCLWLFLLTPFVRRIVDYRTSFTEGSLLMLAPYAAGALSFLLLPRFLTRRGLRGQLALTAVFLTIFYGFLVAMLYGRAAAGAFDALRWSVPPALTAYIVLNGEDHRALTADVRAAVLIALPALALYGLYQFASPPAWDALWMTGSKMASIGTPQPFQVRTFSTLNAPGAFASYLVFLLLIAFSLRTPLRYAGILLGLATLVTTLVRSAWLTFAVGLLPLLLIGTWRTKRSIAASLATAVAILPLIAISPQVQQTIGTRVNSLFELSRDTSASERSRGYELMMDELKDHLLGEGSGVAGAYQSYGGAGGGQERMIDGAVIEIYLAYGVFGGTLYLFALGAVVIAVGRVRPAYDGDLAAPAKCVVFAFTLALTSGTMVAGEVGFLFWLCCGLALAVPSTARLVTRPPGEGSGRINRLPAPPTLARQRRIV